MIAYVYKPKRKQDGKRKAARLWRARLRMPWETKTADVPLGTTDKQAAQQKLTELMREREAERDGRMPPKAVRDALQKPLEDLLEGFLTDLDLQNRSAHYIQVVGSHARRTFAGCGWKYIADVDAGSFLEFRATLRTRKGEVLSARAQNDWLDSLTAFFNWLVSPRKVMKENPLAHIGKVSTKSAKKVKRRALSFGEFDKLLQVAAENRAVYHFAGRTGLRRGEIKQVRVYDLHLDEAQPYVAVRGSTTKNGKDVRIELVSGLVEDLKRLLPANAGADDLVFERVPRVPELCEDLKKAGIPFLDDLGRRLDFHALRQTFNTHLAVSGVSLRERMELLRHSDSKLTEIDYLDVQQLGLRKALAKLPAVTPAGTDSQIDSQATGFRGQVAASAGTHDDDSADMQPVETEDDKHALALCGTSGQWEEDGGGCRNRRFLASIALAECLFFRGNQA